MYKHCYNCGSSDVDTDDYEEMKVALQALVDDINYSNYRTNYCEALWAAKKLLEDAK